MERLKTLKTEGERVSTEVRERTATYVGSGLGIAVGLAWNEAIKALIDYAFPVADDTLVAKFVYAAVLTAIVVVVTMYVIRVPLPEKK